MRSLLKRWCFFLALAAAAFAPAVRAQLSIEITGGGANTLIRVTNQGLIVVDTKNPPPSPDDNYARVMEEIKSVTTQPVKFVINTHHHPDHVGNNQKFIDAGAQVVA